VFSHIPMKTLKFDGNLPELILKGEKVTTWRVNDDKDLQAGDRIKLLRRIDLSEFGVAELTKVKETTFDALVEEDWEGHERFSSAQEMYETYTRYYKFNVTPNTKLKIIKFKLL